MILVVLSTAYDEFCVAKDRRQTIFDIAVYFTYQSIFPDKPEEILVAFSITKNVKFLLNTKGDKSQEVFKYLRGLRGVSYLLILLLHTIFFRLMFPSRNSHNQNMFLEILTATLPIHVDTFLFVSGFLVAINFLKRLER